MAAETAAREQHRKNSRNGSGDVPQAKQDVRYSESVYPLLMPDVEDVLGEMLRCVRQELRKETWETIEVYGTAASDEMEAHLVVSVKTELSAAEALALWDRVGDAVQEWSTSLPKSQQDTALDIAVEVLWDVDHAAV